MTFIFQSNAMEKSQYFVLGIDFGTDSARTIVVNTQNGEELGSDVFYFAPPMFQPFDKIQTVICDGIGNVSWGCHRLTVTDHRSIIIWSAATLMTEPMMKPMLWYNTVAKMPFAA